MKSLIFASRNIKEILRDPISWVFCMGFPLVMLLIMSVVNSSIPAEAGMVLFQIQNLAPGIAMFGLTFIMLFACLLIAGDRTDAFLLRVFTSPMKPSEYIIGYILPLIVLSAGQSLITGIVSAITAAATEGSIDILNMIISIFISLPSIILYICFGLLFGSLVNKNAAPGVCSIIISFSGMLGGIWMDVDAIGGTMAKICNALPFIHSVKCARLAYAGSFGESLAETGIVAVWAIVVAVLAVIVFKKRMKF